jgi:DNA repair exonuclease SbcCD ATPase subunit
MTQEEFEHKIKLSYDQFLISMYTAQQSQNKFLSLNDTQKKDFLLQLMNLHEFAMCKKEAEFEAKSLEQRISDETVKIEKAKSKIDAYNESVDIEYSKQIIDNAAVEIDKMTSEIQELQLVLKPDLSKYFKLETDVQGKLEKLATIRYARNKEHEEFNTLSRMIHPFKPTAPDAECPHCHGELMVQGKSVSKPGDTAIHKANHEAKMNEYREQMKAKKDLIDQYDVQLAQENQLRNLLSKSREKKDQEAESMSY